MFNAYRKTRSHRKLLVTIAAIVAIMSVLVLVGCGCSSTSGTSAGPREDVSAEASVQGASNNAASGNAAGDAESSASSPTGGWGIVSDDAADELAGKIEGLEASALAELEDRENATPVHAKIGEEVEATKNVAVSVVSVEEGPYDHADMTPTVKVTVAMRNLSDKTVAVKASNWDADNSNGQRVDHKLYIKDGSGRRDVRSFAPTRISPHATFTGVVYFDGEALASVIYEPHWLVSSENQYIYFDV